MQFLYFSLFLLQLVLQLSHFIESAFLSRLLVVSHGLQVLLEIEKQLFEPLVLDFKLPNDSILALALPLKLGNSVLSLRIRF